MEDGPATTPEDPPAPDPEPQAGEATCCNCYQGCLTTLDHCLLDVQDAAQACTLACADEASHADEDACIEQCGRESWDGDDACYGASEDCAGGCDAICADSPCEDSLVTYADDNDPECCACLKECALAEEQCYLEAGAETDDCEDACKTSAPEDALFECIDECDAGYQELEWQCAEGIESCKLGCGATCEGVHCWKYGL